MARRQQALTFRGKRRASSANTADAVSLADIYSYIDRALEALLLLAIVVIPVFIFPDSEFVARVGISKTVAVRSVASVMAILLMIRAGFWVVTSLDANEAILDLSAQRIRATGRWTVHSPTGLLAVSVLLFTGVLVLSTATSILPAISMWGSVPGADNGALYTRLSFILLAATVPVVIRSSKSLHRVIVALAVSGGFAGFTAIAQEHTGWFVTTNFYLGRSTGHFGNPLALGSFLIATFPFAVILLIHGREASRTRMTVIAGVAFIFLYGVQLTLSRGPYVGMAVTLVAVVLLYWRTFGTRKATRLAISISAAVLVVTILAVIQTRLPEDSFGEGGEGESSLGESTLGERLTKQRTIEARIETWQASVSLVTERPIIGDSDSAPAVVRHLLGYGPDTFQYALPATSTGFMLRRLISNAHNEALNTLVEVGILGLVAFVMVMASAFLALLRIRRAVSGAGNFLVLAASVALTAALMGRLAEQMTGVARIGDSVMFWIALGLIIALPGVISRRESANSAAATAGVEESGPENQLGFPSERKALFAGALIVIVIAIATPALLAGIWTKNVAYAMADHNLSEARKAVAVNPTRALELYDRAIDLAPDVMKYRHEKSDVLLAMAEASVDPRTVARLYSDAYSVDLDAYDLNRLDRAASFKLAASAWNLAIAGVPGKALEAVELYEYLSRLAPEHELVEPRLKQLYEATGIKPDRP